MGIFRGSTPQILQDLGVAGITYQVTLTLTPEQIRSLNTLPVDIAVPANANTFLAPGQCVFVGAQGSGAYSAAIRPALQYSDATVVCEIDDDTWDGSASQLAVASDPFQIFDSGSVSVWLPQVGLSLQVVSAGTDVTDGDAPCTIILTFTSYDLTGLL